MDHLDIGTRWPVTYSRLASLLPSNITRIGDVAELELIAVDTDYIIPKVKLNGRKYPVELLQIPMDEFLASICQEALPLDQKSDDLMKLVQISREKISKCGQTSHKRRSLPNISDSDLSDRPHNHKAKKIKRKDEQKMLIPVSVHQPLTVDNNMDQEDCDSAEETPVSSTIHQSVPIPLPVADGDQPSQLTDGLLSTLESDESISDIDGDLDEIIPTSNENGPKIQLQAMYSKAQQHYANHEYAIPKLFPSDISFIQDPTRLLLTCIPPEVVTSIISNTNNYIDATQDDYAADHQHRHLTYHEFFEYLLVLMDMTAVGLVSIEDYYGGQTKRKGAMFLTRFNDIHRVIQLSQHFVYSKKSIPPGYDQHEALRKSADLVSEMYSDWMKDIVPECTTTSTSSSYVEFDRAKSIPTSRPDSTDSSSKEQHHLRLHMATIHESQTKLLLKFVPTFSPSPDTMPSHPYRVRSLSIDSMGFHTQTITRNYNCRFIHYLLSVFVSQARLLYMHLNNTSISSRVKKFRPKMIGDHFSTALSRFLYYRHHYVVGTHYLVDRKRLDREYYDNDFASYVHQPRRPTPGNRSKPCINSTNFMRHPRAYHICLPCSLQMRGTRLAYICSLCIKNKHQHSMLVKLIAKLKRAKP